MDCMHVPLALDMSLPGAAKHQAPLLPSSSHFTLLYRGMLTHTLLFQCLSGLRTLYQWDQWVAYLVTS